MTKTIAAKVAIAAFKHAMAEKYPTRSVEYMLAWMMIAWSARVLWPGAIMIGPTYRYLLALAPETTWGWLGLLVGFSRLYALLRNGGWKQSALLRFIGALMGLNFWLVLMALYSAAVDGGAPDFPQRWVYPVFMFFEAYSCYRCGQDHTAALERAKLTSPAGLAGEVRNG